MYKIFIKGKHTFLLLLSSTIIFFIECIRDQFTIVEFGEETKELIAYCENEYMFRFGDTVTSSLGSSENKS